MNIKTGLITLIVGSVIVITTIPVQAESWRYARDISGNDTRYDQRYDTRDKYQGLYQKKSQGQNNEERDNKLRRGKDRPYQQQARLEQDRKQVRSEKRFRYDDRAQDQKYNQKNFHRADYKLGSRRLDGNREHDRNRNRDDDSDRRYDRNDDRKSDQKKYRRADTNQPPARLYKDRDRNRYRDDNRDRSRDRKPD
ncbi:hypothetical protein, partial [Kaarinaea lacus]